MVFKIFKIINGVTYEKGADAKDFSAAQLKAMQEKGWVEPKKVAVTSKKMEGK